MTESNTEQLLKKEVRWFASDCNDNEIVISSRIRLARNLEKLLFLTTESSENLLQAQSIIEKAVLGISNFKEKSLIFKMDEISPFDKRLLFERQLISAEFVKRSNGASLLSQKDGNFSVMVNEEDHLRMQVLSAGLNLTKLWKLIDAVDTQLASVLPYAFDAKLGFLTSCPNNVGTGIRASVMLHLPALVMTKQIEAAINGVNQLGMTVRGIFGEGSDNRGNFFQVSNQSTLGESESKIIKKLIKIVEKLILHERCAREQLICHKQSFLLDRIGRAYGTLQYAYSLTSKEALNLLSTIRLGIELKMFRKLSKDTIGELFMQVHPAHLQRYLGRQMASKQRCEYRASLIRKRLKSLENTI